MKAMSSGLLNKGTTGIVVYQMTEEQLNELAAQVARQVGQTLLLQETTPKQNEKRWIPRKEAAGIIGVSLPTLHNLMNQGAIISRKIGRKTLIDETDLMRKLEAGKLAKYKRKR